MSLYFVYSPSRKSAFFFFGPLSPSPPVAHPSQSILRVLLPQQEAAFKKEWVRVCRVEADLEMQSRQAIKSAKKREKLKNQDVLTPTFYK